MTPFGRFIVGFALSIGAYPVTGIFLGIVAGIAWCVFAFFLKTSSKNSLRWTVLVTGLSYLILIYQLGDLGKIKLH